MRRKVAIIGSGFRGFCDALHLLDRKDLEITIIDSAPFFGGVMNSLSIKGFFVDKGVHIFDSIPIKLAETITEIMQGEVHKIDFVSASAFNGKVTEGFSLPDLNSYDDKELKNKIQNELIELSNLNRDNLPEPKNLKELFQSRYGKTAENIFSKIFKKVYGLKSEEAAPAAIAQTSMGRLKFLDDVEMLQLKQSPWLDTVLAARRKSVGKVDDYVSIYPSDGNAMKGWCEKAMQWLQDKGVSIKLSTKINSISEKNSTCLIDTDSGLINADYVVWANDSINALANILNIKKDVDKFQHGTPMVFTTFMTQANKVKDFTYLQNFDPNQFTYRSAAAGRISSQIDKNGISFVTCECPASTKGDFWSKPHKEIPNIWDEIKRLGIIENDAELVDYDIKKIPSTFKLCKSGYNNAFKDFTTTVNENYKQVIIRDVLPFFRRDIFFDSKHLINLID